MTKSFSQTRKTSFNLDKLKSKVENRKTGGNSSREADSRFWKLTRDKSEVGEATLRFLPGIANSPDDLPFVEVFRHIFEGPGGKLWEVCPNTSGERCAVCAHVSELYKSGSESDKKIGAGRKKQHKYYANVLVVDDPAVPANNGKVFIFEFGPMIFDMLTSKMESEDEENPNFFQVIPFMIDETGADFKLKTHKEDDYVKYSKSFYKKPAPAFKTAQEAEEVLDQQHNLQDYLKSEIAKIKTPEELEKQLARVLKKSTVASTADEKTRSSASMKEVDEDEISSISLDSDEDDVQSKIDALLGD